MKNQKKTSTILRLVAKIKGAWAKAIHLLTNNTSKVKLLVSAVSVVAVAIMTNKATVILALITAVKSKGLVQSIIGIFSQVINLFKIIKNTIADKLMVVMNVIQLGGLIALCKLISLKNFVASKARKMWNWVRELFIIDDVQDDIQRQAA